MYVQKEKKPIWLLTGLPDENKARNAIANMYGFQYRFVGGCVVTKQVRDSINILNKATNEILIKKFGRNWRKNFEERVEYLENRISLNRY